MAAFLEGMQRSGRIYRTRFRRCRLVARRNLSKTNPKLRTMSTRPSLLSRISLRRRRLTSLARSTPTSLTLIFLCSLLRISKTRRPRHLCALSSRTSRRSTRSSSRMTPLRTWLRVSSRKLPRRPASLWINLPPTSRKRGRTTRSISRISGIA